jgi:hypothetical protein
MYEFLAILVFVGAVLGTGYLFFKMEQLNG